MYNELTSRLHSFGELLSLSVKLYTSKFLQLALVPTLIIFPAMALQTYVSLQNVIQLFTAVADRSVLSQTNPFGGSIVISLLLAFVSVVVEIGIIRAAYLYLKDEPVVLMDVIKFSLKKWPAVLVTGIILGFCILGLSILFIIPGIIFGVYWMFTFQATVLEDKVASDAMSLSKRVVENRWLKTFGYILVLGIVVFAISFVVGMMSSALRPDLVRNSDILTASGARDTAGLLRTYANVAESYRSNFASIYLVELLTTFVTLTVGHLWIVFTTVWFINWNKFRVEKTQTVVEAAK